MKINKTLLIYIAAILLTSYLTCSFIALSLNPFAWDAWIRMIFISLLFFAIKTTADYGKS